MRSDFLLHLVERTEKEQQQGEETSEEKSNTGKPSTYYAFTKEIGICTDN